MKKIKVKYCPYNNTDHTTPLTYNNFIHNILTKYYEVEVCKNNPDYFFFHDSSKDYLNYGGIRINYTGENLSANFNLADYAIGFDYLNFADRYYRLPVYLMATFYQKKELEMTAGLDLTRPREFTGQDLKGKTDFCSFVYSNYRADDNRKVFFDKLSKYKKVAAGGKYLNNTGYNVDNKFEFESKHKFSIAFENSSRPGYTTEKIVCSLLANTIPIYWGNPEIAREFNTKRFINCHDYESFDQVVEKIKEIDSDDAMYLKIINQPIFAEGYNPKDILSGFEYFLRNIFDQPLEKAKRRTINPVRIAELEEGERILLKYSKIKNVFKRTLASLYSPFKKIKFLENLKYRWFKNK
ncbi:MAG: glycosyltransferase family 10 [bacterium]